MCVFRIRFIWGFKQIVCESLNCFCIFIDSVEKKKYSENTNPEIELQFFFIFSDSTIEGTFL